VIERVESQAVGFVIYKSLEGDLTICMNDDSLLGPCLGPYKEGSLNSP
jgi:hypothetical protein